MCNDNYIEKFIEGILENVDYLLNNIEEFHYEKFYKNETTELIHNLRNRSYFKLVSFVKKKSKDKFFYLPHPIFNIQTIALRSYYDSSWSNFILLVDKEYKHPWIIIQQHSFINYFIVGQRIYSVCKAWINKNTVNKIINLNITKNKCMEFVFGLGNHRPYHYFVHQYFHYLILKKYSFFADRVKFLKSFYTPKEYYFTTNIDNVTVFLYLIPADYIRKNYGKMIVEKLSIIQQDVLQDVSINNTCAIKYDLSLWIGIPEERRIWKNDIDTIVLILKNLSLYFDKIQIFIDGITSFENETHKIVSEKPNFDRIYLFVKKELQSHYVEDIDRLEKMKCINIEYYNRVLSQNKIIFFKSLSGLTYREKIYYCHKVDIVITESSTTFITPIILCQKPGFVFYGDIQYKKQAELFAFKHYQKVITGEYIYCKNTSEYYLNKEYMYNSIADLLELLSKDNILNLKYLKMHRLNIPSTQLMFEVCKLKDQFDIEFSVQDIILYGELQKLISYNNEKTKYIKNTTILNVNNKTKISNQNTSQLITAKLYVKNHLSYRIGQVIMVNSKNILDIVFMPIYVLAIIISYNQEKKHEHPLSLSVSLKSFPDYQEAIKLKESFTYRLGQSFIKAHKNWYKGGYVKLFFEIYKLKKEFKEKNANKNR